jgi:hypothetical protein
MKKHVLDEALKWLHNHEVKSESIAEPTLSVLATLIGVEIPRASGTSKKKKQIIEEVVGWLRNNDPNAEVLDKPALQVLANLAGVSLPSTTIPNDNMEWLRDNNPQVADMDEPQITTPGKTEED